MKITMNRVDDAFNMEATDELGHKVSIDSSRENGGKDNGVRPMHMVIMGLGGCSAIDVVMILRKQRQEVRDLQISIDAERETGKEPALWAEARLVFTISGKVDPGKAERAVDLSMEKYCSVAETLRRSGTRLSWETRVLP